MLRHLLIGSCALALAACGSDGNGGATGPGDGGNGGGPGGGVPTVAYSGDFHPVSSTGTGMVDIYVSGTRAELRLSDAFSTEPNPNLEVWLVAADDPMDNRTVEESPHVSLGMLRMASGAQSYEIPNGVDLMEYRSVTIWCVSAHVNFATAPLMMN